VSANGIGDGRLRRPFTGRHFRGRNLGIALLLLENSIMVFLSSFIYKIGGDGCYIPRLTNDFAHAKYSS
jgi:hypothetical protein